MRAASRLILALAFSAGMVGPGSADNTGGIFLVDSADKADVTVFIVDSDDVSEANCWVGQDEIDATMQPGDLKVYVTKDPNANATYIAVTDDPSEPDPVDCLRQ